MTQEELKAIGCTPIEELIAEDFGELGTPERTEFELSCDAFIIGEQLKSERIRQGLTQDELANRIGTKIRSNCHNLPFFTNLTAIIYHFLPI